MSDFYYHLIRVIAFLLLFHQKVLAVSIFFEKRKGQGRRLFMLLAVYMFVMPFNFIVLRFAYSNIALQIAFVFAISLLYRGSISKKLMASLLISSLLMATESFNLINYFIPDSYFASFRLRVIAAVGVKLLVQYVLLLLLKNLTHLKNSIEISGKYSMGLVIVPLCTLGLSLVPLRYYDISYPFNEFYRALLLLVTNLLVFYLYDYVYKILDGELQARLIANQTKYYEEQFHLIQATNDNTAMFKHDITNKLIPVHQRVKSSHDDELLNLVEVIMGELGATQPLVNSGNLGIDSVLNYKHKKATDAGLVFNVSVKVPSQLSIAHVEMATILGNLVDNAIEAARQNSGDKWVNIDIKYAKGQLFIRVENSYDGVLHRQFGELMSKKKGGRHRGIGISSVKKTLSQYDGLLNIDHDAQTFTVTAILYA